MNKYLNSSIIIFLSLVTISTGFGSSSGLSDEEMASGLSTPVTPVQSLEPRSPEGKIIKKCKEALAHTPLSPRSRAFITGSKKLAEKKRTLEHFLRALGTQKRTKEFHITLALQDLNTQVHFNGHSYKEQKESFLRKVSPGGISKKAQRKIVEKENACRDAVQELAESAGPLKERHPVFGYIAERKKLLPTPILERGISTVLGS